MERLPTDLEVIDRPLPTPQLSAALRERFPSRSSALAQLALTLLTQQDGSTTRLCEALSGSTAQLRLLNQRVTQDVPQQVRTLLPGASFIERITSLVGHGEVMTDNLVYVAIEGLDAALRSQLQRGEFPIGRLMTEDWLRRETVRVDDAVLDRLWRTVGLADRAAMRCYVLRSQAGAAMLVCETFRRGVLQTAARGL